MRKFLLAACFFTALASSAQNYYLLIGTYTQKGSKGIYTYKFNATTGKAEWVSNTDSAKNPSFLAVSPNKKYVYAVNETNGKDGGLVSAYAFNSSNGKLSFINQQSTGGADPCHLAIDKTKKWITVANYSGGSVTALPVNNDGSVGPHAQVISHTGSSSNKSRQEKAHVHETTFSPSQDFVFTPDLGTDQVFSYGFNPSSSKPLTPASPPFVSVTAGNGPRHITFHPNGKWAYVIEELTGSVGVYNYSHGKLTMIQHLNTHDEGFKGVIGSAEVEVSPDGKFVYASNRGDENNIAIFAVNTTSGKLQLKGYQSTMGKAPRHFIMDPGGNFLLAANQDTDNIVIFKRNKHTGMLQETGDQIKVSMPVCVLLVK